GRLLGSNIIPYTTLFRSEGKLPRDQLLDTGLSALRRDFAPFRAGWFSRFHEALNPTPIERQQREAEYVALLTSPVSATVSFAVRDRKSTRLNSSHVKISY